MALATLFTPVALATEAVALATHFKSVTLATTCGALARTCVALATTQIYAATYLFSYSLLHAHHLTHSPHDFLTSPAMISIISTTSHMITSSISHYIKDLAFIV